MLLYNITVAYSQPYFIYIFIYEGIRCQSNISESIKKHNIHFLIHFRKRQNDKKIYNLGKINYEHNFIPILIHI